MGRKDVTPEAAAVMAEVRTMIEAVIAGRGVKYLMMNAPTDSLEAIEAILPGLESPSVLPLAHEGMHRRPCRGGRQRRPPHPRPAA